MTRNRQFQLLVPLTLALILSACGDGGGSMLASAPQPLPGPISVISQTIIARTPLPPTVATAVGTHDALGWLTDQAFENGGPGAMTGGLLGPSQLRVTVDPAAHAFTVRAQLPDRPIERTYVGSSDTALHSSVATNEFYADFGYHIEFVYNFSDGTKSTVRGQDITTFVTDRSVGTDRTTGRFETSADTFEHSGFVTGIGLNYVSWGGWGVGDFIIDAVSTRQTRGQSAQFVYGVRTAPTDLPLSGSARYTVDGAPNACACTANLDVDFATRMIAADYRKTVQEIRYSGFDAEGNGTGPIGTDFFATHLAGSAPVSSAGNFDIAMAGTAAVHFEPDSGPAVPEIVKDVTGFMSGAFFGPQAAEVGGIWSLPVVANDGTVSSIIETFVGTK